MERSVFSIDSATNEFEYRPALFFFASISIPKILLLFFHNLKKAPFDGTIPIPIGFVSKL
ncbi:hypothetical protein CH367_00655 [Leptospira barantonii]|uniref:Uncharacterized protein n=1 Tax=Leptospira barantonii TaxID=2023184 RepID=A0ABX4NSM0_9LEPT|nr:hypothetical protein CH367_00655 [Leptospira barantonii]